MSISLGATVVHDIPVLSLAPDEAQGCPAVFFIPGFGGRKEDGLGLGYRLARRGFFVASFDSWLHGERYDARLAHAADRDRGGIYPPETGLDTFLLFLRVIYQCQIDVQTLIAHYAADPDKLRLAIYPAGHTATPQMEQDAADWFSQHLL